MLALTAAALLSGPGFFERREVDFWGRRRDAPAVPPQELWEDSTAPAPVRRLLETPSRETAEAYVAWQTERLARLRAAMEAVEALAPKAREILYFGRDGCSWCARQEKELEGLPVVRVPAGSPLWERHAVTVTPTLVVGGRTFRGFTPRAALSREAGRAD
ncbi:MAG TPA: hypothetical protein VEJ18_11700 [Planctomycetota bacterium]|nr:hypothetical protein [Planctomycetota bacterium]